MHKKLICHSLALLAAAAWMMSPAWSHAPGGGEQLPQEMRWSSDPLVITPLAIGCLLYFVGHHALKKRSRAGRGLLRWRTASFWAGMAAATAALLSPIDTLGESLFFMHMLQHELLMLVAAPLLVMGRPLGVMLWACPPVIRRQLAGVVRGRSIRSTWRMLHMPFVAWALHAAVIWAWHAPALFQASLASSAMHTAQHFSFFASALLFWSALTVPHSRLHAGNAVVYLLTTAIHTGMLGALLTFSPSVWYPVYAQTSAQWGWTALEDQQLGGLIMWVPAGFVFLLAGLLMGARLLLPEWQLQPRLPAGAKR